MNRLRDFLDLADAESRTLRNRNLRVCLLPGGSTWYTPTGAGGCKSRWALSLLSLGETKMHTPSKNGPPLL